MDPPLTPMNHLTLFFKKMVLLLLLLHCWTMALSNNKIMRIWAKFSNGLKKKDGFSIIMPTEGELKRWRQEGELRRWRYKNNNKKFLLLPLNILLH